MRGNKIQSAIGSIMKIYLNSVCLNPNGEATAKLSFEVRRKTQSEYAIASKYSHIFDRGNSKITASFEIERSHSSEMEAQSFAISHSAFVGEQSECMLVFELGTSGDDKKDFGLVSAAASKVKTELDGVVSRTAYEFIAATAEEL